MPWNFNQNTNIFIEKKEFENVVFKLTVIFLKPCILAGFVIILTLLLETSLRDYAYVYFVSTITINNILEQLLTVPIIIIEKL